MNQAKLTVLIQLFDSFISGVLTIALPSLMKQRNIDIITIGLVFAGLPMIFQLTRVLFIISIIIFLVNPQFAAERFGWIGLGAWCGIYATLGIVYLLDAAQKSWEGRRQQAGSINRSGRRERQVSK